MNPVGSDISQNALQMFSKCPEAIRGHFSENTQPDVLKMFGLCDLKILSRIPISHATLAACVMCPRALACACCASQLQRNCIIVGHAFIDEYYVCVVIRLGAAVGPGCLTF